MLPLLLLCACISKGDYELIQVQLDATRTALSARNAACYQDGQARDAQVARLEGELEDTRARIVALDERHQQLLAELDDARAKLADLATSCLVPLPDPKAPPTAPLLAATAHELNDALALRSRVEFEREEREEAFQALEQAFATLQEEGRATVLQVEGQAVVRIPSVQIFNEGQVTVSPRGELLLARLAEILAARGGQRVQVAVHTDDRPYHSAEHASSWELGFVQAMTVVRALADAGVSQALSAASYAGTRPLADNATPEGRKANSRVELVFEGGDL
ncbi:MAG: OmpA family protein [Pseudomonadota bacterium]